MKATASALVVAITLALATGHQFAAAQGSASLPVTVDGLKAGSPLSIAMNIGKSASPSTTATTNGQGTLDTVLDLGNMGKAHVEVQVYIGDNCVDRKTRIELVASGTDPSTIPPECKRRLVGAFWLDRARHVTIHAATGTITVESTGMSTTTKAAIGVGAAIAAVGIGVAAKGGNDNTGTTTAAPTTTTSTSTSSSTTTTTTSSTSTTTTTTSTTTTAPSINTFIARWGGTGTATTNSCNFSPTTTISGQTQLVDASMNRISWTKTHVNAGVTFIFNNVTLNITGPTTATFNAATTQAVGSANYNVNDNASINGNAMALVQTFVRTDNGCQVIYQMSLTKQ